MSLKRLTVIVAVVVLALGLVSPLSAAPKVRVAVVAGDRVGDRGFTDSAYNGLLRAAKDFGVSYKVFECKADPSTYFDRTLAAAENFDLVFMCPGYFFDKEIAEIAPMFPKTTFVYIDGVSDIPGLVSINFKEHEGSFLAGALAALMSSRPELKLGKPGKTVGFVGGADWPVIRNFLGGYEQGVKYVDPTIRLEAVFAGTHYDPAKGKEAALQVNRKGANIVFQAAGPTGLGILEAARDAGFYAIGVDIDQCQSQTGYIMGSMLKRVDNAVYDTIQRAIEGKLTRGTNYPYGVKENGVGLCNCEQMKSMVPPEVIEQLRAIRAKVASGEIIVKAYSAPVK
jgi:basic membrane protein A